MQKNQTSNNAARVAGHTPRPWQVAGELDNLRVIAESSNPGACDGIRQVAVVAQGDYEIPNYREAESNARLIAAAPELLAALEMAIEWAKEVPSPYREFPFIKAARAAIAKATK